MTAKKHFFLIFLVLVHIILFLSFPALLSQENESYFNTEKLLNQANESDVNTEKCGQKQAFLAERILHFFTRNTWWDELLCKDTKVNQIGSSIIDLIPLKTLYSEVLPERFGSNNIFFVENNCNLTLPFYVQCGLESAAVLNPSSSVYLFTVASFLEDSSNTIRSLLNQFPNIQIVQVDFDSLLQDTPLESFRSTARWTKNAGFLKAHMSDALRIAILWKEGGVYMDTDTISLKPLPSEDIVLMLEANAFIKSKKYHRILLEIMKVQNSSYDGSWVSMGPAAVSKGVAIYCNGTINEASKCKDITIFPYNSFNPVSWERTDEFLKTPPSINLSDIIKSSTYGFHTSHYMIGSKLNQLGKDNLYDRITREYCPFSYNQNLHS